MGYNKIYLNYVMSTVLNDYDRKIRKLISEEEFPTEYVSIINYRFKNIIKSNLIKSKYDELKLKIKEYEKIKEICNNNRKKK